MIASLPSYAEVSFTDLSSTHWARDSVDKVTEYGIMTGEPNGYFRGDRTLNRYELSVTLANMLSLYDEEFAADREDLSSLVTIMEQFQDELRVLEKRTKDLDQKIAEMEAAKNNFVQLTRAIQSNQSDIENLKERGFLIDTVVKGSARDVKTVFGLRRKKKSIAHDDIIEIEPVSEASMKPLIEQPSEEILEEVDMDSYGSHGDQYDAIYGDMDSQLMNDLDESLNR